MTTKSDVLKALDIYVRYVKRERNHRTPNRKGREQRLEKLVKVARAWTQERSA